MHPDYAKYMTKIPRTEERTRRIRTTPEERAELETIAAVEGGSLTELIVEGVWRVIEDPDRQDSFQKIPETSALWQMRDQALSFRPTQEEVARLEALMKLRKTNFSRLAIEGIWRVIENRRQNKAFQESHEEILALQKRLDQLRSNLHGQRPS